MHTIEIVNLPFSSNCVVQIYIIKWLVRLSPVLYMGCSVKDRLQRLYVSSCLWEVAFIHIIP